MSLAILALVACFLASVPAVNVTVNLLFYRRTPRGDSHGDKPTPVSVVIPARDEEANIRNAASGVLSNAVGNLELLVIDDHSRDRTAEVVTEIARRDPRVRLVSAPALPADWAGKPHSCFAGAREAKGEILVFVDADVRLEQDAVGRLVAFMEETGSDLASGIPRQLTGTLMEKLVIPLIHFILLGFLPMMGMRWTRRPAFAAGCGQLFVARHQAYEQVGGHRAVKASRHDGLQLPRAFRRQHLRTELFDATDLATCRMYRSASEVWNGFAKNATEGMATPLAILPWTLLLLAGQVLPPVLLLAAWLTHAAPPALALAAAATAMVFGTRLLLLWRFEQSVIGALLHPVGILALVAIQWFALIRGSLGLPLAWKGRT
jgi:hypothetical protein